MVVGVQAYACPPHIIYMQRYGNRDVQDPAPASAHTGACHRHLRREACLDAGIDIVEAVTAEWRISLVQSRMPSSSPNEKPLLTLRGLVRATNVIIRFA